MFGFLNKGRKINKVVILDGGNILHKAIFSYMGQYDAYVDAEISKLGFDPKDKENTPIEITKQSMNIIENKISKREIFLMPPIYTYMRMIVGYFKLLSVDLEDTIIIAQDFGSWRKKIDLKYKAQRKAAKEARRDSNWWKQQYDSFNDFFPKLEECLPWHFIKLFELESDDIASVCFSGNTYIASPLKHRTDRQIRNIKKGDKIYSYNIKNNKIELSTVSKIFKRVVDEIYQVYFENGTSLKVTRNHPLYTTKNKWINVENLKVGDEIYYLNSFQSNKYIYIKPNSRNSGEECSKFLENGLKIIKIIKKKKVKKSFVVYNLEVEGNNNYFANNLLAHNCCRYYQNNDIILISSDRDWEMLKYYDNVKIFSPITKKFKVVPNPTAVLLEKIRGDVSDNLLTVPSSEAEYDTRKKIVNLLELPDHIEKQIRKVLVELPIKNIEVDRIPFKSVQKEIKKLYAKDLI